MYMEVIDRMDEGLTAPETWLEQAAFKYVIAHKGILPQQHVENLFSVERTAKGKPYFVNFPDIHFSISHSGAYWACAITDMPVGLDLQKQKMRLEEEKEATTARGLKIASRFFHPTEEEFINIDPFYNFFTVWAAKEAFVKQTGQGIDAHFSEHCVVPEDKLQWKHISGPVCDVSWQAMGKYFWKTEHSSGYTLCVCTQAKPREIKIGFKGRDGEKGDLYAVFR